MGSLLERTSALGSASRWAPGWASAWALGLVCGLGSSWVQELASRRALVLGSSTGKEWGATKALELAWRLVCDLEMVLAGAMALEWSAPEWARALAPETDDGSASEWAHESELALGTA